MSHDPRLEAEFLAGLAAFDAAAAQRVKAAGCLECGNVLDRAYFGRKPRGELGEAEGEYLRRESFCCRRDGCRRRATPPSLRFLGRKVYIGVLVVLASVAGLEGVLVGRGRSARVLDVPVRTVRRWLVWWQTAFVLSTLWQEARGFFARPVDEAAMPASLLASFGAAGTASLGKLLRFLAPITTTSVRARIAMVG